MFPVLQLNIPASGSSNSATFCTNFSYSQFSVSCLLEFEMLEINLMRHFFSSARDCESAGDILKGHLAKAPKNICTSLDTKYVL